MVKMFKNNVRNVLCGVCCAAVVMCRMNEVNGMDESIRRESRIKASCTQTGLDVFRPIALDFPIAIGGADRNMLTWSRAFDSIAHNVSLLLSETQPSCDIEYAYCAIHDVCRSFDTLFKLCSSFPDNVDFRRNVLLFLSIIPRILCDPAITIIDPKLAQEFREFIVIRDADKCGALIKQEDAALFSRVAVAIKVLGKFNDKD
ncbi:MAG: hypothetical protein LBB25_01900 [Holosporaceae bacterium]|jgi:hypothetical protein|nr:hypothetical protein [Holosporaceae bacterium]